MNISNIFDSPIAGHADIISLMKNLNVDGKVFQYRIFTFIGEYGTSEHTEFYDGTEEKKYKKYWLFGPTLTTVEPRFVFRLPYSVESDKHSKSSVRRNIESYVELINRKEQIGRGEII